MDRHDELSHTLHIPKQLKFKQPKPSVPTNITPGASQEPAVGTNSKNQFR